MKAFLMTDQKQFMNQLLKSELFDNFLFIEAAIQGAISYSIDGHTNRDFFDDRELEELGTDHKNYLPFSHFRPICFELIRGTHTPIYMKLVLALSPSNTQKTLASTNCELTASDIAGVFLNLTFREGKMLLTTGISYHTFTLDHSFDEAWDKLAAKFLTNHGIAFDIQ